MIKFIMVLVFVLGSGFISETTKSRNYSPKNNMTYSYTSSHNLLSDQDLCQAEANYMATHNISGHVWGTIGKFEGVGYGHSPNCNTCVPSSKMTLTGDASAKSSNGIWYRVRSWR
jgi:hypothetical protein